ncbi:MAG: plastocyanin/azurin family copper-binding protein [bacterium]
MKLVAALAVVALLLAGCGGTGPVSSHSTPPKGGGSTAPFTPSSTTSSTTSSSTTTSPSSSSSPPAPVVHQVSIHDSSFDPAQITIGRGEAVRWTNNDGTHHTVTSTSGAPASFDSPDLGQGATFSFTFAAAGTYPYHCRYHSGMVASVLVQ